MLFVGNDISLKYVVQLRIEEESSEDAEARVKELEKQVILFICYLYFAKSSGVLFIETTLNSAM